MAILRIGGQHRADELVIRNAQATLSIAQAKAEEEARWKAVGEASRENKRKGIKEFTVDEARYAYKNMGIRVPM